MCVALAVSQPTIVSTVADYYSVLDLCSRVFSGTRDKQPRNTIVIIVIGVLIYLLLVKHVQPQILSKGDQVKRTEIPLLTLRIGWLYSQIGWLSSYLSFYFHIKHSYTPFSLQLDII